MKRKKAREFYGIFIINTRLARIPRFQSYRTAKRRQQKENLELRTFIGKVKEVKQIKKGRGR